MAPLQRPDDLDEQFRQLVGQPDEAIDLVQGALLIAKNVYADLDVGAQAARIEDLADTLNGRLKKVADEKAADFPRRALVAELDFNVHRAQVVG